MSFDNGKNDSVKVKDPQRILGGRFDFAWFIYWLILFVLSIIKQARDEVACTIIFSVSRFNKPLAFAN